MSEASHIHVSASVHATAIVDPSAVVGANTRIDAYAIVGAGVSIGDNCHIKSHAIVTGPMRMGNDNQVFPFCNIGEACQDKKYANEPTELHIGNGNVFREACTVHRGTIQDTGCTIIGNDNLLMVNTHVAHDAVIGDHCILANDTNLAGHVHLGDWVILGGAVQVHQFCHIHAHAMCGVGSVVLKDIPEYVMVQGYPAKPFGINTEGLKRRHFSDDSIRDIRAAYKVIYRKGLTLSEALSELKQQPVQPHIQSFISSIESAKRGIIR